ncbi:MAG: helix-turn-helix domain-containing protein [Acidiferrobacterales bacterium]
MEKEFERMLRRRVGERVRQLRTARRWSQEVLAELAGVHRNYIGHLERAEINVGLVNLARVAESLSVTVGQLVDGP